MVAGASASSTRTLPTVAVSSKISTSPAVAVIAMSLRAWTTPSIEILPLVAVIDTSERSVASSPAPTTALSSTFAVVAAEIVTSPFARALALSSALKYPAVPVSPSAPFVATTALSERPTFVPAVPVRSPPAATRALLATMMSSSVAVTFITPDAATVPRFWTFTFFLAVSVIWLSPL